MNASRVLYYPFSTVENYKGFGKICVSWYVYGREEPVYTVNQSIPVTLGLTSDKELKRQMVSINEYFTESERDELQLYLSKHPDFSAGTYDWLDINLPVTKKLAPLSFVPKGKQRYLYPIFKRDDYDLDFSVVGFYVGKHNDLIRKEYHPGSIMHKLYHDPVSELIAKYNSDQNTSG